MINLAFSEKMPLKLLIFYIWDAPCCFFPSTRRCQNPPKHYVSLTSSWFEEILYRPKYKFGHYHEDVRFLLRIYLLFRAIDASLIVLQILGNYWPFQFKIMNFNYKFSKQNLFEFHFQVLNLFCAFHSNINICKIYIILFLLV